MTLTIAKIKFTSDFRACPYSGVKFVLGSRFEIAKGASKSVIEPQEGESVLKKESIRRRRLFNIDNGSRLVSRLAHSNSYRLKLEC